MPVAAPGPAHPGGHQGIARREFAVERGADAAGLSTLTLWPAKTLDRVAGVAHRLVGRATPAAVVLGAPPPVRARTAMPAVGPMNEVRGRPCRGCPWTLTPCKAERCLPRGRISSFFARTPANGCSTCRSRPTRGRSGRARRDRATAVDGGPRRILACRFASQAAGGRVGWLFPLHDATPFSPSRSARAAHAGGLQPSSNL